MKPAEYLNLTYREYVLMTRAYERMRCKEFEHTRIISYTIAAANRDPSKQFPTMEQYWPLPTDEVEIKSKQEDLNDLQARMMEKYKALFPHKFKAQA